MRRIAIALAAAAALAAGSAAPAEKAPPAPSAESSVWSSYLDFAYIYSSADARTLGERLNGYGKEAGITLERYLRDYFETVAPLESGDAETLHRRKAIAYLLLYLSRGDADALQSAVKSVRELGGRLDRHENRYWYDYVLAHDALERGYAKPFVDLVFDLWLGVVVPIEATYETLDTLALSDAPNSGFSSALPYVYENVARLILLRTQEMGVDRDLDPLGAVVRLLANGRLGAHPDTIPAAASARGYLDRIVERLDGPESDAGSLTFTLALFEAGKHHDHARGLLASEGLSPETLRAVRRTSEAYETALNRSLKPSGHAAVYTRALRQVGELFAAQQRLGVEADLLLPFTMEGAIGVYAQLHGARARGWEKLGYQGVGRPAYVDSMRRLWEEIQEATLNVGDYYLSRSAAEPHQADAHARTAAGIYGRYLAFFNEFATEEGKEAVPDSAYFAAFEAAKGIGDAYLRFAAKPTRGEVEMATDRYRSALSLFPFDRELWPAITAGLGRHGRESEYAMLVRPIVDRVVRSRSVSTWIDQREAYHERIAALRRALSDSLVVMYMGFGEGSEVGRFEQELADLSSKRDALRQELGELSTRRNALLRAGPPAAADEGEALLDSEPNPELADVARRLAEGNELLARLDQQVAARTRALPLYKDALKTDGLIGEMRARRDHPVHVLLRRLYHERLAPLEAAADRGAE
jgi:hypothetical protein